MDTPSESAVRSDRGIGRGDIGAHHRPVTLTYRPADEARGLGLLGAIPVARIGLLGCAGSRCSPSRPNSVRRKRTSRSRNPGASAADRFGKGVSPTMAAVHTLPL